ncbi:hypothetical protein RQP46_008339 [Phenoliferia psychrophenolica]
MLVHVLANPRRVILEAEDHVLVLSLAETPLRVLADWVPTVDYAPLLDAELQGVKPPERLIEGCLGLIELRGSIFLVALGESDLVSLPNPPYVGTGTESVRVVKEVEFYCLDAPLAPSAASRTHPCHGIDQILTNGSFYFSESPSYDLTSRLPTRLTHLRTSAQQSTVYHPLPRSATATTLLPPLITSLPCSPEFTFNYHILSPLLELRERLVPQDRATFSRLPFAIPLIQGFYCQRAAEVGPDQGILTVISRLNPGRSGTRFLCRGIDREGQCANFAETETILRTKNECWSFVQVRGSAPFLWSERPALSTLDITIQPLLKSIQPFRDHFYHLFDSYRVVHAINLMAVQSTGKIGGENALSATYRHLVTDVQEQEDEFKEKLSFQDFDIVQLEGSDGRIQDIPELLDTSIGHIVDEFGATRVAVVGPDGAPGRIVERQQGIFRVNCRDCLDRTNLGATLISSFALDAYLIQLGFPPLPTHPGSLAQQHRELFAENGDALSIIYTSAKALNSIFCATGVATARDLELNVQKSAKRMDSQKVTDPSKQGWIDELTCLPNELLSSIFSSLEHHELLPILRTSRHLGSVASDLFAREAHISSEKNHGAALVHLHRAGADKLRVVDYAIPWNDCDMASYLLSGLTYITHLTIEPGGDILELPILFTDALKKLQALVSLTLDDFYGIMDATFSIGTHLPRLRNLYIKEPHGGLLADSNQLETLSLNPYFEHPDDADDLGPWISSAKETLKHFILGAGTEAPLPIPESYKSLESLKLYEFTLFELEILHRHPIFEILASLSQTSVKRLTLEYHGPFAAKQVGNWSFSVSSVETLDLSAHVNQLDGKDNPTTVRALRKFLKIFPNLHHLLLTGFSEFITPEDLCETEDEIELDVSLMVQNGALTPPTVHRGRQLSPEQLQFDGKVVIVTGAGNGLGKAYATFFASRGASVVVNDFSKKSADEVVKEIQDAGGKAIANYDSVAEGGKIVQQAVDKWGTVHILINNAGFLRDKSFKAMTDVEWDQIFDVHVKGAYACTKAAWPLMRKQKFGRIINRVVPRLAHSLRCMTVGQANYSAAKFALVGFSRTLAREGVKYNIHANSIAPIAASQLTATVMPAEMLAKLSPQMVVPLVAYLVHDQTTENGQLFEAGAGWFGKLRWERSKGAVFKTDESFTPAAVKARWAEVTDFTNPDYPESIADGNSVEALEKSKLMKSNAQSEPITFTGKTVLITGAGAGLGRAYAMLYGKQGANVVVNDMSAKSADAVVAEIKKAGGRAVAVIGSTEDGAPLVKGAVDAFGALHIIVCNAGILRDKSFLAMTDAEWDAVYKVHLRGTYSVCHAAWPIFQKQKYGRIITTTSSVGIYGNFGQANYSTAKAGIIGLTKTLGIEGKKYNILANCIAPAAGTAMTRTVWTEEMVKVFSPDFVAPLVGYLTSEENETTSGLFQCSGGSITEVRWQKTRGYGFPNSVQVTPEAVKAKWDVITRFDHHSSNPMSSSESIAKMVDNFENSGDGDDAEAWADPEDSELVREAKVVRRATGSYTFTERDVALYNLGIGATEKELSLVFEGDEDFQALPSFGVIPPMTVSLSLNFEQWLPNFDFKQLLHGEQYLIIHAPIPTIAEVLDKGKAAAVTTVTKTTDQATGELIFENHSTVFIRKAGGFGGKKTGIDRGAGTAVNKPPARKADAVVEEKTLPIQAALYRLSGDYNPLHIEPSVAAVGGFDQPILHGLCFFGLAGKAVFQTFGAIKELKVRFVGSVYPGETLITEMWKEGNKIIFAS